MKAIVCVDKNFGIGRGAKLPWKNKEDMRFFMEYTWDQAILMGNKTFQGLELPFLPNRDIYVLGRKLKFNNLYSNHKDSASTFGIESIEQAPKNVIICGGRQVYDQFLPNCDELMITKLDDKYDCDVFFPYSQVGLNMIFSKKELVKEIEGGMIWRYTK